MAQWTFKRIAAPYIIAPAASESVGLRLVFDSEADDLLDNARKVHCIVVGNLDSDEINEYGPDQIAPALEHLAHAEYLTGHNILGYDLPLLRRLYNWEPSPGCTVVDTLTVSRLIFPHIAELDDKAAGITKKTLGKLRGRYTIEAWGVRLGIAKTGTDISDWSAWTPEIQERCVGDAKISKALWHLLQPNGYSRRAMELEHRTAAICDRITADGVPFNTDAARQREQEWTTRLALLKTKLEQQFPGTKLTSRPQIGALLEARGWVPAKRTEKTNQPKIDDELLESIPALYPEFAGLAEYHVLKRRLAQLSDGKEAWLKHVRANGRIHGGLIHIGTPHSRAKHLKPNLAQVPNPKKGKPFGSECRALFQSNSDWVFVAADQASLQDRGLAHYLHPHDNGAYAKAFIEGVDTHWKSAITLDLIPEGTERDKENKVHTAIRENAKRFRFAFIYGCQKTTAGRIIYDTVRSVHQIDSTIDLHERFFGQTTRPDTSTLQRVGAQALKRFVDGTPGLGQLRTKLEKYVSKHNWLPGLDGRRVPVRANYTALNYIITSSEAIICKRWMVEVYDELCARFRYGWDGDVLITLWIHDELVTCCRPEIADQVGEIMVRHARKAGEFYNFRVPLDAEYKIGRSWAGDARDGDNKPTIEPIRPEEGADGDGPDETTDTIIPPREEQPQQDQVVHLRQWSHEAIPPTALPPRSSTLGQKAASENVAGEPKSNGLGGNGRVDIRVNSGGSAEFIVIGSEAPDCAAFSGALTEEPKSNNNSSAERAAQYAARGWKPIPIPRGTKGPREEDWPKLNYDPARDFNGMNIGVQLGPVSGGLTDIDLDCVEAVSLAPYFLPQTNTIFGRKSKPRSHWLYITDDPDHEKATIKLTDDNKKAIIELRMGGGGKGAQTVFPGSTHESGEKIEWAESGEPAKNSCTVLNEAITKIAVGALLARYWPANMRHDACLRCGGFLARAGWEPDVIEDFMRAVQCVAGVANLSHINDGCKAAYDAAVKHQADGKGYGLPAMIEVFGEAVCKRLTAFLHYSEDYEKLEKLNEKYCIVPFGGKVRVLTFDRQLIGQLNREVITFYSAADFKLLYDNVPIRVSANKIIGLGAWWLKHPLRRQYEGLVFEPAAPQVIEGRLNLWRGWGIAPRKGCWKKLRKHIFKVLANGDKQTAKYIIKWTAWTFQHPDQQAEVALVFRGKKGTGKGLWGRMLCKIFGQHGIHISSHEHLAGKFNKHLLDCVLLFADEAFWPGDKAAEGTLKRIITEDTLMIEPKFFDPTLNTNHLHIVMVSNANWVVPASIDERRFAVSDVSDKYRGDKNYFKPLYQEIENGGAAAMLYDLLRMDLKDWHPRDEVPKTEALMDQKILSLKAEDQWWLELLKAGQLPGATADNPRRAKSCDLYEAARNTVPGLRFHSDHLLGRILCDQEKGCTACRVDGKRGWQFPPLAEARAAWDRKMPGTEWDVQTEWEWIGEDYSPF